MVSRMFFLISSGGATSTGSSLFAGCFLALPSLPTRFSTGASAPVVSRFRGDPADDVLVDPRLLGDLPVGLLRLRRDQLGNQLTPLLWREVPTVNVLRDDVRSHAVIVVLLVRLNLAAYCVGIDCLAEMVLTRLNPE